MTILRHLWEHQPSRRYPLVKVPVLLLAGRGPATTSAGWPASAHEVAQAGAALDRSVTHWIDGDHDLHAQHPDLVAELIHDATGPGLFP